MGTLLTAIPDHLLAEIFLRLPAPDDLARASAACVSFRRLVTDRSFLRCFRRLHAPPLLGFFDHQGFNSALPPHPSAPAARALALTADFSFSFLPSHRRWKVQDIRDGRVLLHHLRVQGEQLSRFTDLVVCDPVHRRYILLPPVPDDLVPLGRSLCKPFLVPLGEEEEEAAEETAFRVIFLVECTVNVSAFVFSSSTGGWTAPAFKALSDLVCGKGEHPFLQRRHYAYGCFYWDWFLIKSEKLLLLDTRRMEFSMADHPPGDWCSQGIAIVEAGEGRLGMFGFRDGTSAGLSYIIARNKGPSPTEWQMEKRISLGSRYEYYYIKDATEMHLLLRTDSSCSNNSLAVYFSMDIKTLKLQMVCSKLQFYGLYMDHIYTNYPPSLLSSPTI